MGGRARRSSRTVAFVGRAHRFGPETVRNRLEPSAGFSVRATDAPAMSSLLGSPSVSDVVTGLRGCIRDQEPGGRIPVTEVEFFALLSDNRRRATIRLLADPEGSEYLSSRDLAPKVAAAELHMSPDHVPADRVDHIERELAETHLPMLVDAGVLRWHESEERVAAGPAIEPVAHWLEGVSRSLDPIQSQGRTRYAIAANR